MRIYATTAFFALVATVFATPQWRNWQETQVPSEPCLNYTGVSYLISGYTYLLQNPRGEDFNATAEAILSDKFYMKSDSIDTLSNQTLGVSPYPSKQFFIDNQAHTPPIPRVQTLETFHTCDKIAWRWNGTGVGMNAISGIITMTVNPSTVQIDTVFSEFNSGAWLQNLRQR